MYNMSFEFSAQLSTSKKSVDTLYATRLYSYH